MAFDPSTAQLLRRPGSFDPATARPIEEEVKPAPVVPPVNPNNQALPPVSGRPDSFSDDTLDVLGEFANSINIGIPQLLDMPSHVVNWMLEKGGVDFRIPATMEDNFKEKVPGGEGGFMDPGMARDAVRTGGQLTAAAIGMMPVQRTAGTIGSLMADYLGAGSTMATQPLKTGAMVLRDQADQIAIMPGERAARESAKLPLLRQSGDASAAGYRLNSAGQVVPDAVQRETIKQGFQPKLVAMVNSATSLGKKKMLQMLDNVQMQRTNMLNDNMRPSNVAGESILARAKVANRARVAAGKRLGAIAEDLKSSTVDATSVGNQLLDDLNEMGIKYKDGVIDFSDSAIDGLDGPQAVVTRIFNRLKRPNKSAYDLHMLKRFLDEQLTYGKEVEGLSGNVDRIFKNFRHGINQVLGDAFPEYGRVNKQYHETIQALDDLQSIAGKRMDLTGPNADRALGILSRRVFSNAQSAVPLDDALNQLDEVARKYVTPNTTDIVPYKVIQESAGVRPQDLEDSLQAQIRFASELERHFKIAPTNSFQGVTEKAGEVLQSGIEGGTRGVIRDTVVNTMDKIRGINEDNAMIQLRRLLEE